METKKQHTCPKCGSTKLEFGRLFRKGTLEDVRFRSESAAPLSFKKEILARACLNCGNIELGLRPEELEGNE